MSKKISLIVAMGQQRQIGLKGKIPWHLKADLLNFKKLTIGHPVIMGRKTFESIGKALPNRLNIVLTSQPPKIDLPDICPVPDLKTAIEKAILTNPEIFIIGGETLYRQALPLAHQLIITHVDYDGPADTYFPAVNWTDWQKIQQQNFSKDKNNDYSFKIVTYTKKM